LAKSEGKAKILGLVLSNSLVALCGAVVCQEQRSFSSTMGTGQMVLGLASVIIGLTVFKKLSFVKLTTAALVGSILYKFCIQAAILAGLDPSLLKLITAVLFLAILAVGSLGRRKGGGARA
ncbi:MAG: ABC transporter permease, partial [Clostridia bacterium]|nr:ABC transporter permease [Clostridia bacterium]